MSLAKALYIEAIKNWARMPIIGAELSFQVAIVLMAGWLLKVIAVILLVITCVAVLIGTAWAFFSNPSEAWVLFLFVYVPVVALIVQNIYLSRKY
ncbi:hypothetical protein ASE13_01265 [Sphingomonas sp. Root241]|nr:hypothetical protein ASE13_01265 [Sphingomonas sp. Root241]